MTNLDRAREAARACRAAVGGGSQGLLERLVDYLWSKYRIEPRAATSEKMGGSLAELRGRVIFYDKALDDDPALLLLVLAHELGHLVLHPRVRRRSGPPDPILAASYLAGERGVALSRYNPKAREEAEATAFATEFVCPSDTAFELWRTSAVATSGSVARETGVSRDTCRAQLVEGLAAWLAKDRSPVGEGGAFSPNPSQCAAIAHCGGPALIDAGPGTGKTATLVSRVEALVQNGVAPSCIVVLTFSNEAAGELRSRVEAVIPGDAALEVTVSTIHGLGREFLHLHGDRAGVSPDAAVLDEYGQVDLVLTAIGQLPPGPLLQPRNPRETAVEAVRHINHIKQRVDGAGTPWCARSLREVLSTHSSPSPEHAAFADLFEAYEALKAQQNALDFSDLIALPIRILRKHPEIQEAYHRKYRHVLVDEFQDVSGSCALLLHALTSDKTPPWVVGDPRQAIYRFLGAAPENVTDFESLFGDTTHFTLSTNYRSHPGIVTVANELATLVTNPEADAAVPTWVPASEEGVEGKAAVAVAESDAAEVLGVVDYVQNLLKGGTPPHHVAVLARRNLDVRRVVAALAAAGVRANAAGTLSPEGSAGDLAAVLTLPDAPRASIPRVTHALGPDLDIETVDRAISALLDAVRQDKSFESDALDGSTPDVAFDVVRAMERLSGERYTSDGFGVLTAFLFDGGSYLRRLLAAATSANADAAAPAVHRLAEVVASLARAAAYRVLQPGVAPKEARLRFAEHFRRTLSDATPTAVSPRPVEGAVQVMTCHAAKGLEFEHVVLVGQSAPRKPTSYPWLPDEFNSSLEAEEQEQADALLFVGATRAKQGLLVSYSTSATGAARSTRRTPARLFSTWMDTFGPTPEVWPAPPPDPTSHAIEIAWAPTLQARRLKARSLDTSTCALKVTVEDVLRLRFPEPERPLYPLFFEAVRFVLSQTLKTAWATDSPVSRDVVLGLLEKAWRGVEVEPHAHGDLYYALAKRYVTGFAEAYRPALGTYTPLGDTVALEDGGPDVHLGLVGVFLRPGGTPVALLFRPESYAEKLRADGEAIPWSNLSSGKRLPFALLREAYPDLEPLVFSGADGLLYRYAWSTRAGSETKLVEQARNRARAIASRQLDYRVSGWACDRCSSRVGCPHHLRARGRDFF